MERLTSHFYHESLSILRDNLEEFKYGAKDWADSLRRVFNTAMELKGHILLWGKEIEVAWPAFGEAFDPVFMTQERAHDLEHSGKVLTTLFPGVVEKDADRVSMAKAYSKEGLVFKSLVLLQPK